MLHWAKDDTNDVNIFFVKTYSSHLGILWENVAITLKILVCVHPSPLMSLIVSVLVWNHLRVCDCVYLLNSYPSPARSDTKLPRAAAAENKRKRDMIRKCEWKLRLVSRTARRLTVQIDSSGIRSWRLFHHVKQNKKLFSMYHSRA